MSKTRDSAAVEQFTTKRMLLAGFACFLLTLLIRFPAAPVLSRVSLPAHIEVQSISGSVWSGHCLLRAETLPAGLQSIVLDWALNPLSLFLLALSADIEIRVADSSFSAVVSIGPFGQTIKGLSGAVDVTRVAQSMGHKLQMPERVLLEEVAVSWNHEAFSQAQGSLQWPGGKVSYLGGRKPYSSELSALKGVISDKDGKLYLEISEQDSLVRLLGVTLGTDGIVKAAVYRQAMSLAGMSISQGDPTESVFEWSGPIW